MKGFSAFLDMRGFKDSDHEISSWKYLSKDLFHQFSWSRKCLSLPEFPWGHVEGQKLQQSKIQSLERQMANALGKCQFVIDILMVKTHIKKYTTVVINGNENHMRYIFTLTKMAKV